MLALLTASCEAPPPPEKAPPAPRRFTAQSFGYADQTEHRPTARVGDETREVVLAPADWDAARLDVETDDEGGARATGDLTSQAVGLPEAAFRVRATAAGWDEPDPALAEMRGLELSIGTPLEGGWNVETEGGAVTVTIAPGVLEAGLPYKLALRAVGTLPKEIESQPVSFESGDRLRLAFGLVEVPPGRDRVEARFVASVDCDGAAPRTLLDEVVVAAAGEPSGWQERAVEVPAPAHACRLLLRVEGNDGVDRVAVWGVPKLESRVGANPHPNNLVLISLDTLRADHLSGYGYARETSPELDRKMIARGTTFEAASSPFPLTLPAHLSLFSGLYPGSVRAFIVRPDTPVSLLAERLRDRGLTTAAFTEGGLMSAHFGLAHGFESYVERDFSLDDRGRPTFEDGARFVREHADEPFFLFLHTYKTHAPYVSDAAYGSFFTGEGETEGGPFVREVMPVLRAEVDDYDRTIRQVDDQLAGFLEELERAGVADRTWVIVTSDHGEAFGEHGHARHGQNGHEEQLRVPLVFRGPGIAAGHRVLEPVGLIDVAPTVLDLYGLGGSANLHGKSLVRALRGEPVLAYRPLLHRVFGGGKRGIRIGNMKLVQKGEVTAVYDLAVDPRETTNVAVPRGVATKALEQERRRLSREIRERAEAIRAKSKNDEPAPVDGKLRDSLQALGYVD